VKAPQLASVWRSVSLGVNVTVSDAELLRRYQLDKSEDDFAALVHRYGRLVWMVCRNLTRCEADTDDAFQAVFLVFLRNAHKLRDAGKLPAWLHGVAYRVCSKARLSATRRQVRETKRAKPDAAVPVPDSRWDEALAAVQEEVARLPETLRVPFVVCCLEGVGQVEAAKNLGWKLGTLSGRLTRAKDRLMARLEARGVVMSLAGFVAGLALGSAPAASVAKVMMISTVGAVVPTTILQLSTGVLGMGSTKLKLLLAGFFVTGGLGLGVGSGWINTAGAQQSGGPAKEKVAEKETLDQKKQLSKLDADMKELEAKKLYLQMEMEGKQKELAQKAVVVKLQADEAKKTAEQAKQLKVVIDHDKKPAEKAVEMTYTVALDSKDSPKWEYDVIPSKPSGKQDFISFVNTKEKAGWEFVGNNMFLEGKEQVPCWVFRKPTKDKLQTVTFTHAGNEKLNTGGQPYVAVVQGKITTDKGQTLTVTDDGKGKPATGKQTLTITDDGKAILVLDEVKKVTDGNKNTMVLEEVRRRYEPKLDVAIAAGNSTDAQVKELKAQIEKLQTQLSNVQQLPKSEVLRYLPTSVSAELFSDTLDFLTQQGTKKFPKEFKLTNQRETGILLVEGSPSAVKWAKEMLDKLVGARPTKPEAEPTRR
jgi:RNA polymerase sigma factor (sigma-70 family)